MLNREDFDIFVPASGFLGKKLRETNQMDITHIQKRERMRGFCKRKGIIFVKINGDCTCLYTKFKAHCGITKMDIELKDPGLLISITKEDEPENTI